VQLDRAWIAAHIPHQGTMCLLDGVESWDAQRIVCSTASHRSFDNPLRAHGRLATACGIEYAAQAMAVHGALLAGEDGAVRQGMLASARGVQAQVARLDDIAEDLTIEAEHVGGDENNLLYRFSIRAIGRLLLEGRAAVVLDANALQRFLLNR
jgi:predicted hotdog family 3-hydroxylacyl-ACP dehydratase